MWSFGFPIIYKHTDRQTPYVIGDKKRAHAVFTENILAFEKLNKVRERPDSA